MIEIQQLEVQYQQQDTFHFSIPSLTIDEGECVVVCGMSGSGKSTLLRVLNGLVPEYYAAKVTGKVCLNGVSLLEQSVEERSYLIGSVFQNPATQFFHRQVEAELVFPCENQGIESSAIQARLMSVTELLKLGDLLEEDLLSLSGGQRQRVALATALMQQPQLLLLDEPTANLDSQGILQIKEALQRVKALGLTIIISEHRLHFLSEIADRYIYFDQGTLTREWTRDEFQALTQHERQQLGLRSRSESAARARVEELKQQDLGSRSIDSTGLQLNKLAIGYKDTLCYIPTMTLPMNRVIGIVGENGVGKSTLLMTIAGLLAEKAGELVFCGQQLTQKQRLQQTAFVMQDTRLQMVTPTVEEEIQLGTSQDIHAICQQLGLTQFLQQHPLSLSGGQQQRVMVAHALLAEKKVYLFDEPTSGLDYLQMLEVSHLLKQLASDDKIVIVVSHDQELLAHCCDQIVALQ